MSLPAAHREHHRAALALKKGQAKIIPPWWRRLLVWLLRPFRFGKAVAAHVANGRVEAPADVQAERAAACGTCPHHDDARDACRKCGCTNLRLKRSWAEQQCPDKPPRWKRCTPLPLVPAEPPSWRKKFAASQGDETERGVWPDRWWEQGEARAAFREMMRERITKGFLLPQKPLSGRGVVLLGGGDRYSIGLYVCVRMLRHHGWTGPIQIWHRGQDEPLPEALFTAHGVEIVDAHAFREQHPCRRWGMDKWGDPGNRWLSWGLKSYAVLHSPFREVLYLDADAYPVAPVDQLFENNPTGTLIWHDLPGMAHNLRWDVFGVADPGGLSWQGGQWLVDKARCWTALQLYRWLDDWSDFTYRHGYGDQDNLRLAWAATETPHHAYPYRDGRAVPAQPKHGCLRAWGPDGSTFVIQHRISDKEFRQDFRLAAGRLTVRDRWAGEELVQGFAAEFRHLTTATPEAVFTTIYRTGAWGAPGSSGSGSDPDGEAGFYCRLVPALLRLAGASSVVDLGCGDGRVLAALAAECPEVAFTGVDVVPHVLDGLRAAQPQHAWLHVDLCDASACFFRLPQADVYLAKDVFHHWPTERIRTFLANLRERGDCRWLIACQDRHQPDAAADCELGGYRALDGRMPPLVEFGPVHVADFAHKAVWLIPVAS